MSQCYRHDENPATNKCFTCMRPICDSCVSTRTAEMTCVACAEKALVAQRRAASVKIVALVVIGVVVAAAIAFFVKTYEPPFDYGHFAPDISRLQAQLDREPCDRQKALDLVDTMEQAGDYRGVLQRTDAFFAKCGDMPRLRWLTFGAHKHLSEFDLAAAEATKLIESDKTDRDFWWWRGDAWFLKGDFAKALADYQQVQSLCPRCTVGWQIADTAEKLGRPCDGLAPLVQTLSFHPDASDVEVLQKRVDGLRTQCGVKLDESATVTERGANIIAAPPATPPTPPPPPPGATPRRLR